MSVFALVPWLARRGSLERASRWRRPLPIRPTLEALEHRNLPSTLVVTSTDDTGGLGDGSLRGEILAAENGDQIVFDPSLAGQTITLANTSELLLTKNLTIQGLGADQLTLSGANNTRVFEIALGVTDTITGLTIAHGNPGGEAGGILNAGTLNLISVTLTGNTAYVGGSIENYGAMFLSSVTVTGNSATLGGGIYNAGEMTIDSSTLSGNSALAGSGGGVFNSAEGTLLITSSVLTGNTAATGGSIYNDGALTLSSVTVAGSSASIGGGIYNAGEMTITTSNVGGNMATFFGGGIYNSGDLTMDACVVSGNTTTYFGGGICTFGTLTLSNSMLFGNSPDDIFGDYSDDGSNIFG